MCNGHYEFRAYINTVDTTKYGETLIFTATNEVGISEISDSKLRIYPNPTTGQLTIEEKGEHIGSPLQIEIYNVLGQNVGANLCVRPIDSETATIDISHLANGIYYLEINNQVVKFVKE